MRLPKYLSRKINQDRKNIVNSKLESERNHLEHHILAFTYSFDSIEFRAIDYNERPAIAKRIRKLYKKSSI